MKHSPNDPEDLLVLARRGGLSSQQLGQFQHELRASSTLWVADEVRRAFDEIAEVHEGDEQRIAASVDRVIERSSPRAARTPRMSRFGLVAAIVLGSASAMGYWGVRSFGHGSQPAGTAAATVGAQQPGPSTAAGHVRPRSRAGNDLATPPISGSAEQASSLGSDSDRASAASHVRVESIRPSGRSAAALSFPAGEAGPATVFSAANAARRAGRQDRAIALYRDLQRDYPRSAETSLSHVSLGRLLLARRELQGALVQFSRYLGGGGPLEEEALLGKAQTLGALARQEDARVVWQTLLGRYPRSVYAGEAREHLGRERR